jgi:predicted outer membrane repeat protein
MKRQLLAVAVLILVATMAPAATLNVPAQYPTIQAAINAAATGDEIVVADGLYTGTGNRDLDFGGKDITIRSAGGNPSACIIDCEYSGRGFYFHGGETAAAVVEGFTIRNGRATENSPGDWYGGGVYCSNSSPTLTNCTISGNSAVATILISSGGGVYGSSSASPTLIGCTITDNVAAYGGGVTCGTGTTLINCTISGNRANLRGGGVMCGGTTLTNCTISENTSSYGFGGGVFCSGSGTTLTNCIITGNTAIHVYDYDGGGGVYCSGSSPTLTNCMINGNSAYSGGGLNCSDSSNPTLINCTFVGNTATSAGGGVCCWWTSSNPTLTNCTIVRNTATNSGGGVYCGSSPTLTNCILRNNTPQQIAVSAGTPSVTYCNVQGGFTGAGNTSLAPLFLDPDGPDNDPATWQDNDYHLSSGSPCIDVGNNTAVPAGVMTDLDGLPRFVDDPASTDCRYLPGTCGTAPIVDMGAYEYQPPVLVPGDLDGDGDVDIADLAQLLAHYGTTTGATYADGDIDGDDDVDLSDLAALLANYGIGG